MKVLIACEYSGIVRDAFLRAGHDAMSCDILPTESPGPHYQGNVMDILHDGWDLMVGHPPCTYFTNAGNRWYWEDSTVCTKEERWKRFYQAVDFWRMLWNAPIERIALENPEPSKYAAHFIGKPNDKVQPYHYGHKETKGICLWLKNLPPLMSTMMMEEPEPLVHFASPGEDRAKIRSRFYEGIAAAMVHQWQ